MIDKLNVQFIKTRKFTDGGGLNLAINASGSIHWRLSYRFDEKQKTLILGSYPKLTLAQACKKRDKIKTEISADNDLIKNKQQKALFKTITQD